MAAQQERQRGCKRARQEALSLAEPSRAALVHHLRPTLQPRYRGSPPATEGVSPTKRGKKKTQSPPLPPQFGVLFSLGCCSTGTKCSPCAAEGTSEGSRLQGADMSSLRRKAGMANLEPAHQRGSGAHQQGGREAKVSDMPPSCFLPPHWPQHPLHPQTRGLCTGLGLWIKPASQDVAGKE